MTHTLLAGLQLLSVAVGFSLYSFTILILWLMVQDRWPRLIDGLFRSNWSVMVLVATLLFLSLLVAGRLSEIAFGIPT